VLAVRTYDRHASPSVDHGGIIRESTLPPNRLSPPLPPLVPRGCFTAGRRTFRHPRPGDRAGVASAFTPACFRYTTLATRLLETLCVCSRLIRIRPHLDGPSPHP
jgi:hypothetical protein